VKAKILVVDDEPDAVDLIEFNLKQAGFDVMTAADGAEALKKAHVVLPDLIVLDVMLPELDGMEVCKIIRRNAAGVDCVRRGQLNADGRVKMRAPRANCLLASGFRLECSWSARSLFL